MSNVATLCTVRFSASWVPGLQLLHFLISSCFLPCLWLPFSVFPLHIARNFSKLDIRFGTRPYHFFYSKRRPYTGKVRSDREPYARWRKITPLFFEGFLTISHLQKGMLFQTTKRRQTNVEISTAYYFHFSLCLEKLQQKGTSQSVRSVYVMGRSMIGTILWIATVKFVNQILSLSPLGSETKIGSWLVFVLAIAAVWQHLLLAINLRFLKETITVKQLRSSSNKNCGNSTEVWNSVRLQREDWPVAEWAL